MEVKLIVVGGKHPGKTIPVAGPEFVIGRADDCQLRPQSGRVSRRHCAIRLGDGVAAVQDLGSSNGTFVNDQRLTAEHPLKSGDHLKVGPLEFEVQLTFSVSGKRKPKVRNVQEAIARTVETAAGEEVDVSTWLDDDEDEVEKGHAEDTAPHRSSQTSAAAKAEAEKPSPPAARREEAPKSKKPGSFLDADEPTKKVTTESSCEAAADMLKRFLRR
jgi:pSer/pThr/pTyr-binding forkhead associated (FHA) protein